MEKAIAFLTGLLTSLGFSMEGHRVVICDEDGSKDVTVGDKALVIPTKDLLNNPDWSKQIAFQPLCENTFRGESEIQQELTVMVRSALNIRLSALIWRLVKVAAAGVDNKLNPSQAEFLPHLIGFDNTMATNFGKLIKLVDPSAYKTSLIHLNLNRRCKIGDKKFERACLVRFPLSEMDRSEKPYSVLRVKDMDALKSLLEYILPSWDLENAYSAGTDNKVAPYFTAVVSVYHALNSRITKIAKLFSDDFPEFAPLVSDDTWWDEMGNLAKMRDSLPELLGNEGSLPKGGGNVEAPVITSSAPAPARGISVPVKAAPKAEIDLPWEDSKAVQEKPVNAPRRNDEAVEYVPRQPVHAAPVASQWMQPQGQIPAGYAPQGGAQTFHQLSQQRAQQRGGYYAQQPATIPPIGGSPYASSAHGQPLTQQPQQYPQQHQQPLYNPMPNPTIPGRGF